MFNINQDLLIDNKVLLERDMLEMSDKEIWLRKFSKYWTKEVVEKDFEDYTSFFKNNDVAFLFYSFLTSVIHKEAKFNITMIHQPYYKKLKEYLKNYEMPYIYYFKKWWKTFAKRKYKLQAKNNIEYLATIITRLITIFITPENAMSYMKNNKIEDVAYLVSILKSEKLIESLNDNVNNIYSLNDKISFFLENRDNSFFNLHIKPDIIFYLEKFNFFTSLNFRTFAILKKYYFNEIVNITKEDFEVLKNLQKEEEIVNYFEKFNLIGEECFYNLDIILDEKPEELNLIKNNNITLLKYLVINKQYDALELINKFFNSNYSRFLLLFLSLPKKDREAEGETCQYFDIIHTFILNIKMKDYTIFDENKKILIIFANLLSREPLFFNKYIIKDDVYETINLFY